MEKSTSIITTIDRKYEALLARMDDLYQKSQSWYTCVSSSFLMEDEWRIVMKYYPAQACVVYDGGYSQAQKKKVFFTSEGVAIEKDIVCLKARIDQRFRKISHRDVLGALMHLQVKPDSFGDFWVEEDAIYLYTSRSMVSFFTMHLTKINQLSVHFEESPIFKEQVFAFKELRVIAASGRLDALVAAITHMSRQKAKEWVSSGQVKVNQMVVLVPDAICNTNDTLSIRGYGRFIFDGIEGNTKSQRIVAKVRQYV